MPLEDLRIQSSRAGETGWPELLAVGGVLRAKLAFTVVGCWAISSVSSMSFCQPCSLRPWPRLSPCSLFSDFCRLAVSVSTLNHFIG